MADGVSLSPWEKEPTLKRVGLKQGRCFSSPKGRRQRRTRCAPRKTSSVLETLLKSGSPPTQVSAFKLGFKPRTKVFIYAFSSLLPPASSIDAFLCNSLELVHRVKKFQN